MFFKVKLVFIALMLSVLACSCSTNQTLKGKVIDLSYSFGEDTIYWPTSPEFELEEVASGLTKEGYYYAANIFSAAEHGGTHIDAPRHFNADGNTVDEIPLDQLIGPAILVDVSAHCETNPDYQVVIEDFLEWERKNGQIPNGNIVLLKTGFGRYWPNRVRYMGTDERGDEAVKKLHFPGLHPEAARWLVKSRAIKAVGLDTPSIDYGQSTRFESHVILFKENVPALENLANLDPLPLKNFTVIALPMKIKGGSGGPTRVVAIVQRAKK